jgi:thiamine kinase-like enzyme
MHPEAIAARLWPGRNVQIQPLGGGITNHNFKVDVGADSYVVRIGGKDTEVLGIDRRAEHVAALTAAAAGLGPEVVAFLEREGALVTRFVEGRPVPLEEMRTPRAIGRVADALRRFHASPAVPARFNPFRVVETYAAEATRRGMAIPPVYDAAHELAARIERARGRQLLRPCHNDLLNANFILDGERLWIVDWEYAGMGDVFFDLANFAVNHELGPRDEDELLVAYLGERREQDAAALPLMRFMSDFREAMWGVLQQAVSELDFDFADYTERHFERLAATSAAPRFTAALQTLETT